jgi:hypothetical protein
VVLAGGGGVVVDSGEGRRWGVCPDVWWASPSPSTPLGRRSRGGGGTVWAIDDGVVATMVGGALWDRSDHLLQRRSCQGGLCHTGALRGSKAQTRSSHKSMNWWQRSLHHYSSKWGKRKLGQLRAAWGGWWARGAPWRERAPDWLICGGRGAMGLPVTGELMEQAKMATAGALMEKGRGRRCWGAFVDAGQGKAWGGHGACGTGRRSRGTAARRQARWGDAHATRGSDWEELTGGPRRGDVKLTSGPGCI